MAMRPTKKGEYIVVVKHRRGGREQSRPQTRTRRSDSLKMTGATRTSHNSKEGWQFDDGTFEVTDIDEKNDA